VRDLLFPRRKQQQIPRFARNDNFRSVNSKRPTWDITCAAIYDAVIINPAALIMTRIGKRRQGRSRQLLERARLLRLLKRSEKQIPRGLKPARDDKKELRGAPKRCAPSKHRLKPTFPAACEAVPLQSAEVLMNDPG
jgi:hypothetical protein